jgi:hypothetical protein
MGLVRAAGGLADAKCAGATDLQAAEMVTGRSWVEQLLRISSPLNPHATYRAAQQVHDKSAQLRRTLAQCYEAHLAKEPQHRTSYNPCATRQSTNSIKYNTLAAPNPSPVPPAAPAVTRPSHVASLHMPHATKHTAHIAHNTLLHPNLSPPGRRTPAATASVL